MTPQLLNFDASPVASETRPTRIDPDSKLAQVAALFMRKRGEWIDSEDLARVGGRCAWRTRVSECRTLLGMNISNRQRKEARWHGVRSDETFTVSEYRYIPVSGEGQ